MEKLVSDALELLPKSGEVEFNAYKAQIQTAMPDKAKDVFTYILKNGLIGKVAKYNPDGKISVYLSRKA